MIRRRTMCIEQSIVPKATFRKVAFGKRAKVTIGIVIIVAMRFISPAFAERTELGFADSLYKAGDYSGAVLAYKRALYYAPDAVVTEKTKLGLAKAYFSNKQYTDAETLLNDLVEHGKLHKKDAQWLLAAQYYQQKNYDFAAIEFKDYSDTYKDDTALYLSGWSFLKNYQYDKAALAFGSFKDRTSSAYQAAALQLQDKALSSNGLPQKNVGLAQFFSYIIPGSGQLYAENWSDAGVSFLINALTISLLSSAIQNNRTGEALIWFTLETAWYFGGVYSAGNSATKYNENVKKKQVEVLEQEYNPDKLLSK